MKSSDYLIEPQFQNYLQKNEEIQWSGQPGLTLFTTSDIFLIPFSLLWGGFAIFWESTAITSFNKTSANVPLTMEIIFPLFGIPFVLIGLYFIFGRFIYKTWKKRHTYYALTDRRVLILTKTRGTNLQSANINNISNINVSMAGNGNGTLIFDTGMPSVRWFLTGFGSGSWGNTGMDFFFRQQGAMAFYDIRDAFTVNKLLEESRSRTVSG